MILMYPVITMTKPFMHKGSRNALIGENPEPALAQNYSNELQVSEDTPPTFRPLGDEEYRLKNYDIEAWWQIISPLKCISFHPGGTRIFPCINKGHLSEWTDLCITWIKVQGRINSK